MYGIDSRITKPLYPFKFVVPLAKGQARFFFFFFKAENAKVLSEIFGHFACF